MFPPQPETCPNCGREYIERRRVAVGNWFGTPDGHWYVHDRERTGEGNSLWRILDQCYVEFERSSPDTL